MARTYKRYGMHVSKNPPSYTKPHKAKYKTGGYLWEWESESGAYLISLEGVNRQWHTVSVTAATGDGSKVVYENTFKTKKEALDMIDKLQTMRWDV